MPPSIRTKRFKLSDEYHLFAIDCWWAGLLQTGLKEIVGVEWEGLGQQQFRLSVHWLPVEGGQKLNVGHPEYADMSSEDLEEIMQDLLSEFEVCHEEYEALKLKVEQWGLELSEEKARDGSHMLLYRDDLDLAEKLIATDYLWPAYISLKGFLRLQRTKLRELDRERRVRKESDYYSVQVDRGMLRETFVDQMGYDNEWLFEDVEELDCSGDE